MKDDNPFDKKLDANSKMPAAFRDALVDVVDTLDFAWAGALAVFDKRAQPEHAIALVPLLMARADELGRRRQAEWSSRMEAAAEQARASAAGAKSYRKARGLPDRQ